MRPLWVILLLVFLGGAGYLAFFRETVQRGAIKGATFMSEPIVVKTRDGVTIAGDFYSGGSRGVLFLHMMPANRKSWTAFAEKLQSAGFSALAIDLRGHGESQGGPEGYKKFSDEEHQASRLDVEAAAEFLKEKGVVELSLAGASIGANLALQYLVDKAEAHSAILLSPGLDYRGVKIDSALQRLQTNQGVYLVASEEDSYSFESVQMLATQTPLSDKRVLKIFQNSGHGTVMLEQNAEFMDELIGWLKKF
ncbi:MAG: alpha/beta fold hydrolase [Candidatus Sungiibacteriota bacterium]|uniref:Alpha/beta fold hydrolase n=1 Tax=Candidatus Sungiibacteriota bacterium TaxID=2750080 RepID=A0A7T5RIS2_9BACT|nr:MAG: alpha/beta fold hydrolase [Candidatus Sungbacteria bacterium]